MRRLILRSFQSPGDILMLTAAVRDLHAAAPGKFQTDVRTACPALWENNPYITRIKEHEAGVEVLDMQYPLIHQSNQRPYHFIHGYAQYLEERVLPVGVPKRLPRRRARLRQERAGRMAGVLSRCGAIVSRSLGGASARIRAAPGR